MHEQYGANVYLEDFVVSTDGKTLEMTVHDDPLRRNDQYRNIVDILQNRLNFVIHIDESARDSIRDAEEEYTKFEEFSKYAKKIRNNECNPKQFAHFQERMKDLKVQLKFFQLLGSYHLAFASNACNFSVPGSGKTITTYAAYHYLKVQEPETSKKVQYMLVVGPLSCFQAWQADFEKAFGARPRCLQIYGDTDRSFIRQQLESTSMDYELILITYNSLPTYLEYLTAFMSLNKKQVMVVLDEAHRIKKYEDGLWSEAALRLPPHANSRVVLTGTPAPNGYEDLYNLYKFIWPSNRVIGFSYGQLARMSRDAPDSRVEVMHEQIEPFYVRVTKGQLDLPKPIFCTPDSIAMGPVQQVIYDAINQSTPRLQHDAQNNPSLFKSRLIRLRQAASNPDLLNFKLDSYYDELEGDYVNRMELVDGCLDLSPQVQQKIKEYRRLEVPEKFKVALKHCEYVRSQGGKVIIWCEFVRNILSLKEYLDKNNIQAALLYGAVPYKERVDIIKSFHDDDDLGVIIANPHAVGESISLHLACNNAVYFEQSFNAATYMQSKDRIHRLGLAADAEVKYYFLHSRSTVDEVIHSRVLGKESRMLEIVESKCIPLFTENANYLEDSEDDIKALIKHYYENTSRLV
ncbi:DEAD/DEAH box helicase [Candidatus Saccharibacteria bacterium]|nr:DEAD/DEAH box helicase [Candidatus Saccharibacteria bacterium]